MPMENIQEHIPSSDFFSTNEDLTKLTQIQLINLLTNCRGELTKAHHQIIQLKDFLRILFREYKNLVKQDKSINLLCSDSLTNCGVITVASSPSVPDISSHMDSIQYRVSEQLNGSVNYGRMVPRHLSAVPETPAPTPNITPSNSVPNSGLNPDMIVDRPHRGSSYPYDTNILHKMVPPPHYYHSYSSQSQLHSQSQPSLRKNHDNSNLTLGIIPSDSLSPTPFNTPLHFTQSVSSGHNSHISSPENEENRRNGLLQHKRNLTPMDLNTPRITDGKYTTDELKSDGGDVQNLTVPLHEYQEDVALTTTITDEESKIPLNIGNTKKNNFYSIQEIFTSLVNYEPTGEEKEIEKSTTQDFSSQGKSVFTLVEHEYLDSIIKKCTSKHWNTLEEFTIRPVVVSRRGKDECILHRQQIHQSKQNTVFQDRKLIPTSQLLQNLLDVKKISVRYPEDALVASSEIENILVHSGLFKKTSQGLTNGEMQEKDDAINIFAQCCVFMIIVADVNHEKKLKWRVYVDGGYDACYDEVYNHIRSARNYLQRLQGHKFDSKSLNKGLSSENDCHSEGTISMALSNLWLEFGPEWIDYCFVFLCSWEDCESANDLQARISEWRQKVSTVLNTNEISNHTHSSSE